MDGAWAVPYRDEGVIDAVGGNASIERGLTPVVGIALLVVIVVLLSGLVGFMFVGLAENAPDDAPQLYVDMEGSDAGLDVMPEVITGEIDVLINGERILTLDRGDKHETFLLPVAPEDDVHFVADVGRTALLKQRHVDPHEAGDFIAYYPFQEQSGGTVPDRSPNDNDASIENGGAWVTDDEGTALAFDGDDDYAKVDQLELRSDHAVTEFTVAVKYRIDGPNGAGKIQNLVEHYHANDFEWYLETDGAPAGGAYEMGYAIGDPTNPDVTSGSLDVGETYVVVGTYDGDEMRLYVDGTKVGTAPKSKDAEMGALVLGADAPDGDQQRLNGRIYQFRLYYTAFDDEDVEVLTRVMHAEAESR